MTASACSPRNGVRPVNRSEQNGADAVDVGCGSEIFRRALRLLRRDVTGRAENRQRAREIARSVEPFGQTKIAHQSVRRAHRARCFRV